jgi:hypothetical protein
MERELLKRLIELVEDEQIRAETPEADLELCLIVEEAKKLVNPKHKSSSPDIPEEPEEDSACW